MVNSYILFRKNIGLQSVDQLSQQINFGDYVIRCSAETHYLYAKKNNIETVVIGFCVDAAGEFGNDGSADWIASCGNLNWDAIEDRLAGTYVIFYRNNCCYKIFGDATNTIPICYGMGYVSSDEKLIATLSKVELMPEVRQIECGVFHSGLTMPGDYTVYNGIKVLLPNHYLDVASQQSIRYWPRKKMSPCRTKEDIDRIIDDSIARLSNITRGLSKLVHLSCAFTAGWDSRVAVACLTRFACPGSYNFFTTKTKSLVETSPDLVIPAAISKAKNLDYAQIEHLKAPEDFRTEMERLKPYGAKCNHDFQYTCHVLWPKAAIVSSDIIGQIGKVGCTGDLPELFAGIPFFMTKQGNSSLVFYRLMKHWYAAARMMRRFGYSMYDLWSWEFRCGRWVSGTYADSSRGGIPMVNIFNNHRMIENWCAIKKSRRRKNEIHREILKKLDIGLLDYPINPERFSLVNVIKKSDILWMIGGYIKMLSNSIRRCCMPEKELKINADDICINESRTRAV